MARTNAACLLAVAGLALGVLVGGCRAEPRVATPATTDTTVTSGVVHVTAAPEQQPEPFCRAEKSYFPVADPISVACGARDAPKFNPGASALSADDEDGLRRLADCATTGPLAGRTLLLVGHADPGGTPEGNRGLGLERAERVRDRLEALGVDRSRLKMTSRGDLESDGFDEVTWTDRRVDILLAD